MLKSEGRPRDQSLEEGLLQCVAQTQQVVFTHPGARVATIISANPCRSPAGVAPLNEQTGGQEQEGLCECSETVSSPTRDPRVHSESSCAMPTGHPHSSFLLAQGLCWDSVRCTNIMRMLDTTWVDRYVYMYVVKWSHRV